MKNHKKSRVHCSAVLNVLSSSKSLKSKYQMGFAKTLTETEFCFCQSFCKNDFKLLLDDRTFKTTEQCTLDFLWFFVFYF